MKNNGQFEKGHVPFNKGKTLEEYVSTESLEKIKQTQFKKGVYTLENHKSWKGGVQFNKNDCVYVSTGTNERVRRPKAVYEKHFGEVPKGFVIIHKNKNKDDDEPENLLAISRGDLMKLNSNKTPITMDELIEKYSKEE
jgi:hypothetical protein